MYVPKTIIPKIGLFYPILDKLALILKLSKSRQIAF